MGLGQRAATRKLIYVHRKLTGFVEDFRPSRAAVPTVEEDGEVFGTFTNQYFDNSDLPKRNYEAFVLQTAYRLTEPLARWRDTGPSC